MQQFKEIEMKVRCYISQTNENSFVNASGVCLFIDLVFEQSLHASVDKTKRHFWGQKGKTKLSLG